MGKGVPWKLEETGICQSVKDMEVKAAEGVERKRWRGEQIKRKEKSGEIG